MASFAIATPNPLIPCQAAKPLHGNLHNKNPAMTVASLKYFRAPPISQRSSETLLPPPFLKGTLNISCSTPSPQR